ncbi:hypothetical protein SCA6_011503 [Theobroma cacao]
MKKYTPHLFIRIQSMLFLIEKVSDAGLQVLPVGLSGFAPLHDLLHFCGKSPFAKTGRDYMLIDGYRIEFKFGIESNIVELRKQFC